MTPIPGGLAGKRPDRASPVYSQRCKEAYKNVPVVLGGIEASLRRIAHYDYWSDKVRRSVLMDATADILLYGNAERAIVEVAQRPRVASRLKRSPTCAAPRSYARTHRRLVRDRLHPHRPPGKIDKIINPYVNTQDLSACAIEKDKAAGRPERSPAGGAAAAPEAGA